MTAVLIVLPFIVMALAYALGRAATREHPHARTVRNIERLEAELLPHLVDGFRPLYRELALEAPYMDDTERRRVAHALVADVPYRCTCQEIPSYESHGFHVPMEVELDPRCPLHGYYYGEPVEVVTDQLTGRTAML